MTANSLGKYTSTAILLHKRKSRMKCYTLDTNCPWSLQLKKERNTWKNHNYLIPTHWHAIKTTTINTYWKNNTSGHNLGQQKAAFFPLLKNWYFTLNRIRQGNEKFPKWKKSINIHVMGSNNYPEEECPRLGLQVMQTKCAVFEKPWTDRLYRN